MKKEYYRRALLAAKEVIATFEEGGYNGHERCKTDCATIAVVGTKNIHHVSNTACHAGLNDREYGMPDNGDRIAVIHSIQHCCTKPLLHEEKLKFLDWLLNRSPYCSVFVSKSAKSALKREVIICDADTPANLMAGGMVAARTLSEYVTVVRVWFDLVNLGVNENLAFLVGHIIQTNRERTYISFDALAGHCSIDGYNIGEEIVENFINSKPISLKGSYKNQSNYSGLHVTWHKGGHLDKSFTEFVWGTVKKTPKKDAPLVKRNPFAIIEEKKLDINYRDAIVHLSTVLKEKYNV